MQRRTLLLAAIHFALAASTAAWARSDEVIRRNNFGTELLFLREDPALAGLKNDPRLTRPLEGS